MMETGSAFAKIIPGTSGTLDIIWSESGVKEGKFSFEAQGKGVNTKLLLNMKKNSLYQFGIPGITTTAEGIVDWLKTVIAQLKPKHIRTFGHSAGASAAIGFGYMINADTIIAVGPEIELGVPRYRSFEWSIEKQYHPRFRDLRKTVKELGDRLHIYFPGFDTSDYRSIHAVMNTPGVNITYLRSMHSGARQIAWKKLAMAPGPLPNKDLLLRPAYSFTYDKEAVWRGVASFEAIGRADLFAISLLESLIKTNPHQGFYYRLAAQKALLGEFELAEDYWRRATNKTAITPGWFAVEYRTLVPRPAFVKAKAFFELLSPRTPKVKPAMLPSNDLIQEFRAVAE